MATVKQARKCSDIEYLAIENETSEKWIPILKDINALEASYISGYCLMKLCLEGWLSPDTRHAVQDEIDGNMFPAKND